MHISPIPTFLRVNPTGSGGGEQVFNTSRMKRDVEKFYFPLSKEYLGVEGMMDREKKCVHYMEEKIKMVNRKKEKSGNQEKEAEF